MVAYSFKRLFVPAIRIGLGLDPQDPEPGARQPKRQTIRAIGRRRHAQPGDTLQLYTAMRTKQCEKIGDARCTEVRRIEILFPFPGGRKKPAVCIGHRTTSNWLASQELDYFAARDGFEKWEDLAEFWRVNHPGVTDFVGVMIRWEPL